MSNTDINQKLTSAQIVKRILMVQMMQAKGDPNFREYHSTVYDDGVWKIDLEMFAISGVIRFWVSREDKYGNYQNSLFTIYRSDKGEIRYAVDYPVKKTIIEKMIRIFTTMEKAGIQL